MRKFGSFPPILIACVFASTPGHAESRTSHESDEGVLVPYHKHRDTRFGHDHSYPDRGAIVREVPKDAAVVSYAGTSYRFHDGVWLEPRGPVFMVVAPPIGLIVATLPTFSTVLAQRGKTVLYANDTFYLPRPDVGGYEVINDPSEPSDDPKKDPPSAAPAVALAAAPAAGAAIGSVAADAGAAAPAVPAAAVNAVDVGGAALPAASSVPPVADAATTVITPLAAGPAVAMVGASGAPSVESAAAPKAGTAIVYPRNGQSADQQARDRYECYRFGVTQSGFDPMRAAGSAPGVKAGTQSDFERAQGVCLDAKGYSVR
jgi:hypothetical protein